MLDETLGFFNPWWYGEYDAPGIERNIYLQKIAKAFELQKAVIIFGLRRVGKTTLLKQ